MKGNSPFNRTAAQEYRDEVMGQGNNRGPLGRSAKESEFYAQCFGNPAKPKKQEPKEEPQASKSKDKAKVQPELREPISDDGGDSKDSPKGEKPQEPAKSPKKTPTPEEKGDKPTPAQQVKEPANGAARANAPKNDGASATTPKDGSASATEEPRVDKPKIRSSATIDIVPFSDDVRISLNDLKDSESMIASVHDANIIDVRLERLSIQVCASSKELADKVRALAKSHKPVKYERKEFYFTRGEDGLKDPSSPAFKTKEEAKASFGQDVLTFLEENGSDTDFLIVQEEGYADANGEYVCDILSGPPAQPKPRINVSGELIFNGRRYFTKFHDEGTIAPALGDLFVQIVGTDPERTSRMEALIEADRKAHLPKMRIGYWVFHQDHPALTKEKAEALAYREAMSKLDPRAARLLEMTGGKLKLPKTMIDVYEQLPGGKLGKRVPDELAREFMRNSGFKPAK